MLHCLCGSPSILLSFTLASVLPRRHTYRVSFDTARVEPSYIKYTSFTARTTRVSNPVCSPCFRASASDKLENRFRHRCSSTYLRISPLHVEFHFLRHTLKKCSFKCSSEVELRNFTSDLHIRLRTLYAQ